jgi:DNA-binding CsgD family transcriptional regulator
MPAVVVGRDVESRAALHFLTEMKHGGPSVLMISGEPGIGKTTLLVSLIAQARATSYRILQTRPAQAESKLAFAGLSDLFSGVDEIAFEALPEPQRHGLAVALLREEPGARRLDRRVVSAATLSLLGQLSSQASVLIAIDDIQWLDQPSARVIEYALRRLADVSVGVVACRRTESSSTETPRSIELQAAVSDECFRELHLGPLREGELGEIIDDRLDRRLPRKTLARLLSACGGNPFFAVELARSLPAVATVGSGTFPLPPSLRQLVNARIASLTPLARHAVLAASALRSPTIDLVASGVGFPVGPVQRALESAEAAGIITIDPASVGISFSHPLYAAGVYAAASPVARRAVHRRVARQIAGIEERARHLALGAGRADADLANTIDSAADHARSRGAPEVASDLAEHALRLTPASRTEDILRRTIAVAEYKFHAGEIVLARQMLEAVLRLETPAAVRADALRVLGELTYHQDSFHEALEFLAEALTLGGGDAAAACRLELQITFCAQVVGDFAVACEHAHRALALSGSVDVAGLRAQALAVVTIAEFLTGAGLDEARLREALELEDPLSPGEMALRPSLIAGCLYLYVGLLAEAVRILEQVRAGVVERGEESELPFVVSNLSWCSCWQGDLDAAYRYAQESRHTAVRLGSLTDECLALGYGSVGDAYRGDLQVARKNADRAFALSRSTGNSVVELWSRWAIGVVELQRGDHQAVDNALGPVVQLVERHGLPEPVRVMFVADEIEALVGLGQLDRAEHLIDILEDAGTRLSRAWAIVGARRGRALLLAAKGDLAGASKSAVSALEWCRDLELRLEVARTLLVAGRIERRRKRKSAARDLLSRSHQLFEVCGATVWAEIARVELDRVPALRAAAELTTTERLVAGLSAKGLTNRDVASRLHISPKTVESNLAKVYRKLGIKSRAELGARLALESVDNNKRET